MARNYHLCCKEIKKSVWIGQGSLLKPEIMMLYSGDEKILANLGVFLNKTKGKSLILLDEQDLSEDEYGDFTEFKSEALE